MKNIEIKCVVCGNSHLVKMCNRNTKCCSRGCANKYRSSKIPRPSCNFCGCTVHRRLSHCFRNLDKNVFCNKSCESEFRKRRIMVECQVCNKKFERRISSIKSRVFCCKKCESIGMKDFRKNISIKYRSYGECAIVCLLRKNYNHLKILTNDRSQLNGYEMDIWIPELNVGIEYNGQHHFKPVYGNKVFESTKTSDTKKHELSVDKGIKLVYVIPNGNVSKGHKSKIIEMFIKCCFDIGLPNPTIFNFTSEEVYNEQKMNRPSGNRFINLGRKWTTTQKHKFSYLRSKLYVLKSCCGEIVETKNLKEFCKSQNIQYTHMVAQLKRGNSCKGWTKVN